MQHEGMAPAPGTYRSSDLSPVDFSKALDLWVPLAYDTLTDATAVYFGAARFVTSFSAVNTTYEITNARITGSSGRTEWRRHTQ